MLHAFDAVGRKWAFYFDTHLVFFPNVTIYTQKKNRMCINSTGTQDNLFYMCRGVRYCEL